MHIYPQFVHTLFFKKNIDKIKKRTSLQDFADICYTSQSSISRFSQYLGYANFNDFKADCIGIQEETDEMIIRYSSD